MHPLMKPSTSRAETTGCYLDKFSSNAEAVDPVPPVDWKKIEDLGEVARTHPPRRTRAPTHSCQQIEFIGEAGDAVSNAKIHLDYHSIGYKMNAIFPPVCCFRSPRATPCT